MSRLIVDGHGPVALSLEGLLTVIFCIQALLSWIGFILKSYRSHNQILINIAILILLLI